MADLFHLKIRKSLADTNLQSALDANAQRRLRVRQVAFATLADPEQFRARAHRVRADVIEHLDTYLEQFAKHATENGMQVHRVANAEQAINIILNLARQHNAELIAKAKTMVSEEIGLNHVLEREGFQVVETDLGEYIVQLRGETPSHIITPAVHLRRQDVGRLFEEKLGIPYTEDIATMTNVARQTLRQVFLNADIGISGVNFGVAETGTLCIVTNEGNGRMVTTLPRVHIALMGIERMVPTMNDLGLMLSLLPRSATGQKLTVYTSLLNGPRRPGDPDGPLERHIILVDNGRSAVRESSLKEILYCIRCGACLNACPVFREIGGHAYVSVNGKISPYSGPMGSIVSPALFGQSEFGQLARASSLCGACKEVCPVDIDLPKLLLRVRAGIGVDQTAPANKPNAPTVLAEGLKFYSTMAASPKRFAVAQRLAGFFGGLATFLYRRDGWIRLPAFSGWGLSKDFPRPAAKPFHARYRNLIKSTSGAYDMVTGKHEHSSDLPPMIDRATHLAQENLTMKFAAELEALGVKFTLCEGEEAAQRVLSFLQERGIGEILAWEASKFPVPVVDKLAKAGITIMNQDGEANKDLSHTRVGLTGAMAACAETGSLLLMGGIGRPLEASLLPEEHIVLMREEDIVERLTSILEREDLKNTSAAVLVTGPSRTADIEMALTIGVHGPGKVQVICIKSVT